MAFLGDMQFRKLGEYPACCCENIIERTLQRIERIYSCGLFGT
jgi:hypothetical protein